MAIISIWICYSSHTNQMFHILEKWVHNGKCSFLLIHLKLCRSYVATLLNQTPTFGSLVVRLVVQYKHFIDTCCDEIGLYAQNLSTISGSIVNTMGRIYATTQKKKKKKKSPRSHITFACQL